MHQSRAFLKSALVPIILLGMFSLLVLAYAIFDLPTFDEAVAASSRYYAEHGYWVALTGALAEGTLFINWYLPGSIVVVFGVVFARENSLYAPAVVGVIMIGFMLAMILNYFLGRFGWYRLFLRLGLKEPLERIKQRLENRGSSLIFGSYFHPNVGALTATSAGILRFPVGKFLKYSAIALVLWNTLWGVAAYFAGPAILHIFNSYFIVAGLLIWIGVIALKFFYDLRKAPRGGQL